MPVPTDEELDEFIEEALAAKLEAIDKVQGRIWRRKRNVLTLLLVFFVPATFAATMWYGTDGAGANFEFASAWAVPFAMIGIFAALYAGIRWRYMTDEIPFEYEPDVVAPLIYFLDPRLGYRPREGVSISDVEDSQMAPAPIDELQCGAFFEGTIRTIDLRLGEVEAKNRERGGLRKKVTFQFDGIFLVAEYKGEVDGHTVIASSADSRAGSELEVIDGGKEKAIDDLHIFSSAPEATRELLGPAIIERIAELPRPLFLSMAKNRLILAYEGPDYFEQPRSHAITDTSHLHRVGRQLSAAIDLVEALEMRVMA